MNTLFEHALMAFTHLSRRRKSCAARSRSSASPTAGRILSIESLEDRRLLAAAAKIEAFPMGSLDNSSTASQNSFRIYNNATEVREITAVTIDLRTSLLPDVVYDPNGTGGDVVGIPFTANTGAAATGQTTHAFSAPRDGGFGVLTVNFNDFDPGEMFGFRVDLDPTSVKGSAQPGPEHAASVSGLEISGATVTVQFDDGSSLTGQLFALEEGASFYRVHSEATLTQEAVLPAPSISLVGVATPAIVQSAAQTVRITGPAGAAVRLLQTEVALHLAGVPDGGFDVDPFEGNKVVLVRGSTAEIGVGGYVDVPITLTDSLTAGGLTYLSAVIDAGARTGPMSNVLKVALFNLPPGSNITPPTPGDFDEDGDVDGADFLFWQRGPATADDLEDWRDNFGVSPDQAAAPLTLAASRSAAADETKSPQWLRVTPTYELVDRIFNELGGSASILGKLRKLRRG